MVNFQQLLFVAGALAIILCTGRITQAAAQELPVPCYAFEQDALGRWIATAPLSMNTQHGMIDIMPGHPVSVPVAKILNARCP